MEIIKEGKYPEENKMTCNDCQCEFQYYDAEIITKTSTSLEQEMFCGLQIHKYLKCPQCGATCTIINNFYEDRNLLTEAKEYLEKRRKKLKIKKCDCFQGIRKYQNSKAKFYYFLWWQIKIQNNKEE